MTKKPLAIIVQVQTSYLKDHSQPLSQKFTWSYEVSIKNESDEIVQLLNRFWRITDMTGKIENVQGAGVIGLQPMIKPSKQFTYTSYCQLITPQGTMEGHYEMQNLEEEYFAIEIPKVILTAPSTITKSYKEKLH